MILYAARDDNSSLLYLYDKMPERSKLTNQWLPAKDRHIVGSLCLNDEVAGEIQIQWEDEPMEITIKAIRKGGEK